MNMTMFGQAGIKDIQFKFLECYTGHNGMDFQIATELGYIIHKHPNDEFIIVSDDAGFDVLSSYWKDRNINVNRKGVKQEQPKQQTPAKTEPANPTTTNPASEPEPQKDPIKQAYENKLKNHGLTEKEITEITEILYETMRLPQNERKLETYNRLQKKYGSKKGQATYNELKTLIKTISTSGPFPPIKTKNKKKAKLLKKIVNLCPDLKPKEQKKIHNILKSARQNKKQEKKQRQYKTQLEVSFGTQRAEILFNKTQHLLQEE